MEWLIEIQSIHLPLVNSVWSTTARIGSDEGEFKCTEIIRQVSCG